MTEEEIEAQASAPDPDPWPELDDAADASSDGRGSLFGGPCVGGPWDGRQVEVRFPKGFLLVHRPLKQVWLYDFLGGEFIARTEKAELLSDEGRMRAALEFTYDIRVVDA